MSPFEDKQYSIRRRTGWWKVSLAIGIVPLTIGLVLSSVLPLEFAVIIVMGTILVSGTMAIWMHASEQATGDEWWQDDDCSGWRGY